MPVPVFEVEQDMLAALTEAISSDLDLNRVLQTVTDVGTQLSGAQFGAFFYNGVDELGQLYQLHVVSGIGMETFAAMPSPRITPLFEPTFNGMATIRIADLHRDRRVTGMPPGHLPVRSYLATPVLSRTGEVIGALLFGHGEPEVFDERCERAVRLVAAQAAVAVENARLFAAEQAARRRLERTNERLTLLQSLSGRIATAMTVADAVQAVAETLAAPLGVDRLGVYLRCEGGYRALAGMTADGRTTMRVPMLSDDVSNPVADAVATGAPVVLPDVDEGVVRYPGLSALLAADTGAGVIVPLFVSGGFEGALVLVWAQPRATDPAEVEMLTVAAAQLSSTLERARLFDAERRARQQLAESTHAATAVSRALQRSLLPRSLAVVDGVNVAVRYQAGASDVEVGGDWYDVVATDGAVTFVIGDVMGHSLTAAALMGQLRTGLHAYLAEGHRLDAAVARANRLLFELDPNVMATCCLVQLDTARGQVQMVRAGHTQPLRCRPDGSVEEIDVAVGVPFGVLPDAVWPVTTLNLEPGERVVLYTDGLVERRDQDIDHGVQALIQLVAGSAATGVEEAADVMLSGLGGDLGDDVALLVCDYVPAALVRESTSFTVSPQPEMVGRARTFTRDALAHWGLSALEDDAALLVSEMLSNVLRHTGSAATLELRRDGQTLRISVSDVDSRHPRVIQSVANTATGGRGMKLVTTLASAWGVEPCGTGKTVWAELVQAC